MAKYRWKLVGGVHNQGGRVYRKGEVIETDADLGTKFVNKFELVGGPAPVPAATPVPPAAPATPPGTLPRAKPVAPQAGEQDAGAPNTQAQDADATTGQETAGNAAPDVRGEDVTAEFPDAKGNDYLVFRQGKTYSVYDVDYPDKPVNPKPVAKAKVAEVVARAMKGA